MLGAYQARSKNDDLLNGGFIIALRAKALPLHSSCDVICVVKKLVYFRKWWSRGESNP